MTKTKNTPEASTLNPKNFEFQNPFMELESSPEGLKDDEVKFRQKKYGFNKLEEKKKKSELIKLLEEFKDTLVVILIFAATVALLSHETTDAVIIYIVVVINGLIGYFQKKKAERAIEALKKMVSPQARAIRNNKQMLIDTEQIVPGDILILSEGDSVAADAVVFETHNFETQEAVLTGESKPVRKAPFNYENSDNQTGIANFVFTGTNVAHGNAKAIVMRTGMRTEFGKIANLTLETKKDLSPLEKESRRIGFVTAVITLAITAAIFLYLFTIQGKELTETFLFAASIAVAAVPEGLPATITISLALGVQRLSKKNAIIKQLSSVETLGATTVICSDKTGTLTRNEMTVTNAFIDNFHLDFDNAGYEPKGKIHITKEEKTVFEYNGKQTQEHNLEELSEKEPNIYKPIEWVSLISLLCNNAELTNQNGKYKVLGDPTEGALLTMAQKIGFDPENVASIYEKVYELPFDSERKMMSQIVQNANSKRIYILTKGAPDNIIEICDQRLSNNRTTIFRKENKEEITQLNEQYAQNALRTIGYAYKEISQKVLDKILQNEDYRDNMEIIEKDLIFLGVTGMIDPPRPEIKDAVRLTRKAGIQTYILTGDHGLTASAIAKEIDLISDNRPHEIITGADLINITDYDLKEKLRDKKTDFVFSRISPQDKLRIVSLIKELGEVVAVTGDGVNDAPALKRADIGVAMGITGTDVSREASNMVLADDSFSSIVVAIKEGRTIYENLKKFMFYIFSSNIGEVSTIFVSILIGLASPLTAVLILTVNLATDLFPALALGTEPSEPDIMNKPPRNPNQKIMNFKFISRYVYMGVLISTIMIALYAYELFQNGWTYGTEIDPDLYIKASTITFVALVMTQVSNAFNARSLTKSVFQQNPMQNPNIIWANLLSIIICIGVVYIPFLQTYLKTTALELADWGLIIGAALIPLFIEEIRKLIVRISHRHA